MEWKNNKIVGIVGIIIILVSIVGILGFILQRKILEERQRKKNLEKWRSKLIIDEQGRIIGARIDERER